LLQSSLISQELESFYSHSTLYCEDLVETVPSLRQFAAAAVLQQLFRNQILKDYFTREYPMRKHVGCSA
jgi:hypothetical protein